MSAPTYQFPNLPVSQLTNFPAHQFPNPQYTNPQYTNFPTYQYTISLISESLHRLQARGAVGGVDPKE